MTEQKIPVSFRPDQLADVIEAVNAYADDLKNDRALLCEMPRVISTHAPAGGATRCSLRRRRRIHHFYSRPCGRGDARNSIPR